MSDLTVADDMQSSAPRRLLMLDEHQQPLPGEFLVLFLMSTAKRR